MSTDNRNMDDENIASKVCDALDDSVNRIDAETSQRIVAARKNALQQTKKRFRVPKLFTAVATAFSILIAVVIVSTQFNQTAEPENTQAVELIATQEATEFYEELEFYTWLAEEDITS